MFKLIVLLLLGLMFIRQFRIDIIRKPDGYYIIYQYFTYDGEGYFPKINKIKIYSKEDENINYY